MKSYNLENVSDLVYHRPVKSEEKQCHLLVLFRLSMLLDQPFLLVADGRANPWLFLFFHIANYEFLQNFSKVMDSVFFVC